MLNPTNQLPQTGGIAGTVPLSTPLVNPQIVTVKFPEDLTTQLDQLAGPRSHHIREAVKLHLRLVKG